MTGKARGRALLYLLLVLASLGHPSVHAAEFEEFADDPSAFTTVIESRDFDDRFETVHDVIDHGAGVRVDRSGGLGAFSSASIRGSKAEQVLVLLDGVRLNSGQRGAVDLSTIPLRMVERIEVVRGGGAARFGSDAVGGVISITSRAPDEPGTADVSGTAGDYGTLGADGLLSLGEDGLDGVLGYSRLRSDNDFDFERGFDGIRFGGNPSATQSADFTRRNAGFVQDTGLARLGLSTGESSELTSTLQLHRTDRGQPGNTFRRSGRLGDGDAAASCLSADEDYGRIVADAAWSHAQVGPGSVELRGFYRWDRNELHDPAGRCAMVDPRNRGRDSLQSTDVQAGGELRYATTSARVGPFDVRTRMSAELRRDSLRSDETDDAERWSTHLFALEELRLWSGRVRLFPALGLDVADIGTVETRIPGLGATASVSPDDGAEWIPKIGAIVRLAPGMRLKANYGRAYRRPNFNELFFPDIGFARGNPDLEPEDAWDFDVGLELSRDGGGPLRNLSFAASYFGSDIEESIELVQVSQFTLEPTNTGEARTRGWELSSSATLFERLDLTANYTWLDSVIPTDSGCALVFCGFQPDDPPLPRQPRNVLFTRALLRLPAGSTWVEASFEDEYALDAAGFTVVPSTWQVDLGVTLRLAHVPGLRRLPDSLSASAEWTNVGNTQRIDSLGFPLPGRMWTVRLRGNTNFGWLD